MFFTCYCSRFTFLLPVYKSIVKSPSIAYNKAKKYSDKIDVELDFATLAIYAESCVRLKKYFELTNGKSPMAGNGKNMLHPILNAISMQEKQIHQCAAKLGLTPDARNKIKLDLAEICKSEVATGRKYNRRKSKDEDRAEVAEEFC